VATKVSLKNALVYLRVLNGDRMGTVDETRCYRIRSLGKRQATLDRVNKNTGVRESYRGFNLYLEDKETAERRNRENANREWRNMAVWDWSQVLVPVGNAGWDADMNF